MSEPLRMVCSLVIVIVGRGMRPFLAARQEVADRGFLLDVAPAARVQLLHLRELLGGEALEAPDEVNELPGLAVVLRTRLAPGRHPREPYPVLDDGEQLAVRQGLCLPERHVRRLGVERLAGPGA